MSIIIIESSKLLASLPVVGTFRNIVVYVTEIPGYLLENNSFIIHFCAMLIIEECFHFFSWRWTMEQALRTLPGAFSIFFAPAKQIEKRNKR